LFEFVALQMAEAFRANNAQGGSCAAEAPRRLKSVDGAILADAKRAWSVGGTTPPMREAQSSSTLIEMHEPSHDRC
jgi:hypothetical protein